MEKWKLVIICFGLMILDNALVPLFSINGAVPSLLFVFAIAYSIVQGKEEAVFIGVVSGLFQDIFFYRGLGVNALGNMFLCLFAAYIGGNILRQKKIIPVLATMLISIIKIAFIGFIFNISDDSIDLNMAMLSAVYNTVVMFIGYKYVLKLCDNKNTNNSWRFKWL